MQTATISAKFQLHIPKKIRDALHIIPSQEFLFIVKGNCLELIPKRDIKDFRGALKGVNAKHIRDRSHRI